MQTAANTNCFLIGNFSLNGIAEAENTASLVGLYQHTFLSRLAHCSNSHQVFTQLAHKLIRLAEHSLDLRDISVLEEVSRVLMNLPVASAQQIGLYYQALAIRRKGQPDQAKLLLETVADNGPLAYRARAIQSLGFIHRVQGQLDEAMRLYLEALQVAPDKDASGLQTTLMAHLEVSIIKSISGDHQRALASLEKLSPLVRLVAARNPFYFYAYHNTLAIELGELGRVAEAEKVLAVALSSPFASVYPELIETRNELEAKRDSATPSQIAFSRAPEVIPSPRASLHRKPKSESAAAFYWLICEPASFQIPLILLTTVAIIAAVGEPRIILARVHNNARPRGPPALLPEVFRLIEEKVGVERSHLIAQLSCAKDCHQPVAISFGVSSVWLDRTICYWLHIHAHDHQQFQIGCLLHHKVNPQSQTRKLRMVWAGCRSRDSPPHLTAHFRVKGFICPNSHVRVQKDGYEYIKKATPQSK